MARIGSDYRSDRWDKTTVTHWAEDDTGRLESTHDVELGCPVCAAERGLRAAEVEYDKALWDWVQQQRKSRT